MKKEMFLFLLTFFSVLAFSLSPVASASGDSFTQKDREMIIRIDERLNQIDKRFEQIDRRFEQVDKRFEELREDMNKRFEQVDKRFEQVDKRFAELRDDMNRRFEEMMNMVYIVTTVFGSLVAAIIAFAFWDRRTMLREMRNEIEKEGRLVDLISAIREYASGRMNLAEALKSVNLL